MSFNHRPGRLRSPRALFAWCGLVLAGAGATERSTAAQSFTLSTGVFGALERSRVLDAPSAPAPVGNPTPSYGGWLLEVSRTHTGARYSYDLLGGSQLRRYDAPGGVAIDNQWAAGAMRAQVTHGTTVTASQRVAYAPLYSPGATSAGPAAVTGTPQPGPASGAAALANLTTTSMLGVTTAISRRTSAAFEYHFDHTGFSSAGTTAFNHGMTAGITKALSRDLTFQLRYGFLWSVTRASGARAAHETHDVEAGLAFSPSASRKTTFAIGVAPNVTAERQPASPPASPRRGLIKLGGYAGADRVFGRTWRAGLGYQRTLYYLPGYGLPIIDNAVNGRMSGSLQSWLTTAVALSYSQGAPDLQGSQSRTAALASSVRLDVRPLRRASVYAEFVRNAYTLTNDLADLPGLGRGSKRSTVRLGLTLDLIRDGRSRVARRER